MTNNTSPSSVSSYPTPPTERYKKRLEGVTATPGLCDLLRQARSNAADVAETTTEDKKYISISMINFIHTTLVDEQHQNALEDALANTQLVFTPPPPSPNNTDEVDTSLTAEQQQHRTRMERLRLKQEERNYSKLTKNIHHAPPEDDVTTRSMTYAASIGLNMIIAPLSFGVFMYFFAGGVMDYIFGRRQVEERLKHTVDVRKVIAGVISGVVMLFIEMILFVIRTHEMDKAIRKKNKRKQKSPFGYYNANTIKNYKEE